MSYKKTHHEPSGNADVLEGPVPTNTYNRKEINGKTSYELEREKDLDGLYTPFFFTGTEEEWKIKVENLKKKYVNDDKALSIIESRDDLTPHYRKLKEFIKENMKK